MKIKSKDIKAHIICFITFIIFGLVIGYVTGKTFSGNPIISCRNSLPTPKLPSKDFIPSINRDWFNDLPKFVKNIKMEEANYFVTEDKGVILDINLKGRQVGKALFPLGIKYKSGEVESWWWISQDLYNVIKIYKVTNGISYPGKIADLRIGQRVVLQEVVNLGFAPSDKRHSHAFIIKIIE